MKKPVIRRFIVNVSWKMFGSYEVEAESEDSARAFVFNGAERFGYFPGDQEMVHGSFVIDSIGPPPADEAP